MNVRLCLLLLALPAAADEPPPKDVLRALAEDSTGQFPGFFELAKDPEVLLDVIFVPAGTDAPDAAILKAAREQVPRLGDESYAERERATAFLKDLGTPISEVLKDALAGDDPEIRLRAAKLLRELSGRPQLADLDYANVQYAIERIVNRMDEAPKVIALAESALRRMGTPTVHGREAWLLKPVFARLATIGGDDAVPVIEAVLKGPHAELAEHACAAVSEAASTGFLCPMFLAAIELHRAEPLAALLARTPRLRPQEPEPALARYRRALDGVIGDHALPDEVRLKAHRLKLIAFFDAASLRVLVDSAKGTSKGADIIALALSDPRLGAIRLEGSERAAELIDHSDPALLRAAGIFLLTRPQLDQQQSGFDFLAHLGDEGEKDLKLRFSSLFEADGLRDALERRVNQKGRNWEIAERLLFALPAKRPALPTFDNPFKFR